MPKDNHKAPFSGELMRCAICGKEQQSDPGIESDWRYIQLDHSGWYFCPAEFPGDHASALAFQLAYNKALAAALIRQILADGKNLSPELMREAQRLGMKF